MIFKTVLFNQHTWAFDLKVSLVSSDAQAMQAGMPGFDSGLPLSKMPKCVNQPIVQITFCPVACSLIGTVEISFCSTNFFKIP